MLNDSPLLFGFIGGKMKKKLPNWSAWTLPFVFVLSFSVYAIEETKLTIDRVTIGIETSIKDGGPDSSVIFDSKVVNEDAILLTLREEIKTGDETRGMAGKIYSDQVILPVRIQGVYFQVKIEASVQVIAGVVGPYVLSGSFQRNGQKFFESVAGVSTKSIEALREVVLVSGRSQERFWINRTTKKIGQANLSIHVTDYQPFGPY